jgi:hypothetical protein
VVSEPLWVSEEIINTGVGAAHQPAQELQPVHARHFHIQGDHVRIGFANALARHDGVGRGGHHFHVRRFVDDAGEQAADQRRIIHHHDSDFALLRCCHFILASWLSRR